MADESSTKSEKAAGDEKSRLPILAAAVGVLIFVVFVAVFSISMGVFSSDNIQPTVLKVPAESDDEAESDDPNHYAGFDESYYDELDELVVPSAADSSDTLTAEDSLEHLKWYEQQKQEIASEWRKLEMAKAETEELKYETSRLIEQRRNLEDANTVQMAKLFDTMKADQVAEIMRNMTDEQVGLILMKMKKQSASKVLAEISADRAAKITLFMINLAEGS
jgi:flagellar motility protein MotE (MotC chaperone)